MLSVCLLLLCMAVIITCKKEYSYEGGLLAQYNLVGSPQECTGATVSGTYTTGTATIDSINTVLLYVDVKQKGKYNITTEQVDGISFAASGVFPDTCSNCGLLLTCKGTPDSAGIFTFHIPGTTGCYFSVTVSDSNIVTADYSLSGAPNDCSNPVEQGTYIKGKSMTTENVVTINVEVTTPGKYNITTDKVNGISFSASGSFTSHGAQQVILQASGTPEVPELSEFQLHADASQCTFYVPVSNAEPVATYVLQSSVNNNNLYCAPGSVQGSYSAGTPLSAGNTLTVNAYVTTVGNFTISTTEQNGIRFSYTGTFTTAGAQDVVLQGSGTPTSIGTYTFYPQIVGSAPLGGSTCGLDVAVK